MGEFEVIFGINVSGTLFDCSTFYWYDKIQQNEPIKKFSTRNIVQRKSGRCRFVTKLKEAKQWNFFVRSHLLSAIRPKCPEKFLASPPPPLSSLQIHSFMKKDPISRWNLLKDRPGGERDGNARNHFSRPDSSRKKTETKNLGSETIS